jgi:hypothetical protein
MEFWTVFGLCCIDGEFRTRALKQLGRVRLGEDNQAGGSRDIIVPASAMKKMSDFIKREGFRLNRFEIGELVRILTIPSVPQLMESLEHWSCCEFPCAVGRSHKHSYDHKTRESEHVDRTKPNEHLMAYKKEMRKKKSARSGSAR